jgi:hypothetical protein
LLDSTYEVGAYPVVAGMVADPDPLKVRIIELERLKMEQ